MIKKPVLFFFLIITILTSCKVQSKHIAGKYVDTTFEDTLQIYSDKSYEYLEKLNNGNLGWTRGQWKIKNRKIYFISNPKPLVDYTLKIRHDISINNFQIKLLLADTQKPIYIEDVKILKNNEVLSSESFTKSKNEVRLFVSDFDSILVSTFNFTTIIFPNTLNKNRGYVAKIYPEERLYELDKVPFKLIEPP